MWMELHHDGKPVLLNTDFCRSVIYATPNRSMSEITFGDDTGLLVDESYEEIKNLIGFANQISAGIHRNAPVYMDKTP